MSDLLDPARLPKRLKVGGYRFKLEFVEADHNDVVDSYGATFFQTGRIVISEGLSLQNLVNTLLHEVQHCINNSYGVDDGADEEHSTTQSANGWQQVYVDNPKLELWLHRAYRELRKAK